MAKWLRRLRAASVMGLTWAAAWFGAGLALFAAGARADVPFPLFFGFLGFLGGVTFSGILGIVERRRRFDEMSIPRFAGWGGLGGLLLSGGLTAASGFGLGALLVLGPVFGVAGAACAAGSLALAKKAEHRELGDAAAELDAVGLTEDEKRELLGDGG